MKKLVVGCLLVAVLLTVLAAVAVYYVWDYVSPVVRTVTDVTEGVTRLGSVAEIEAGLKNVAPYTGPESGELTPAQVDRFLRVQRQVRLALGERGEAFAAKYREMTATKPDGTPTVPSLPQLLAGVRDLSSVYLDASRAQVQAMNAEEFSRAEFSWVRARVYQAAGLDAVRYDAREFEDVLEAVARGAKVEAPTVRLPDAPARNRALVQPHADEVTAWLPMAVFGL